MNLNVSCEKLHAVSPYLYMQFMEPLGTADTSVDAGWDYVNEKWRPELLEIVKRLSPGMVRWGGCFASHYRWKEAVGPMEARKTMLNLAWDGLFSNHVGTKEIVQFCREVGAEPLLVVNMESDGRMRWAYPRRGENRFGTADEAAEWVDYCNNPDNALRISHGDKAPLNVKYWQIGNETSYDKNGYNVRDAARATREFARAMKKADPSIRLIAWGDDGWIPQMCDEAGEDVELMSFHHHFGSGLPDSPLFGTEYRKSAQNTWNHLMHAHESLAEHIARARAEAEPRGKKLAMTEGHFALPGRNRCEVLSSWMAGAAYARCLNEIMRNSDILEIATMADFFGNRWQVNAILLPTPMRPKSKPYLQPVGEVMRLFGRHVGRWAVKIDAPEGVDAAATRDENKIYIHMANTSLADAAKISLKIDGNLPSAARAFEIAPEDPAFEITELTPACFEPVEKAIEGGEYALPPAAVCALEIDI